MSVTVIANPKGGVGKSTLATQVAGCLAAAGHSVMLGDIDPQQSCRQWLNERPAQARLIRTWELGGGHTVRPPAGTTHVVLDTPAGLSGKALTTAMGVATQVLVPLQASLFDIQATHPFLAQIAPLLGPRRVRVGLVAMRVKEHTQSLQRLQEYLAGLGLPLVAVLRDTQNYVQLAAHGLTLFDVAPGRVARDLEQWEPLARWLSASAPD